MPCNQLQHCDSVFGPPFGTAAPSSGGSAGGGGFDGGATRPLPAHQRSSSLGPAGSGSLPSSPAPGPAQQQPPQQPAPLQQPGLPRPLGAGGARPSFGAGPKLCCAAQHSPFMLLVATATAAVRMAQRATGRPCVALVCVDRPLGYKRQSARLLVSAPSGGPQMRPPSGQTMPNGTAPPRPGGFTRPGGESEFIHKCPLLHHRHRVFAKAVADAGLSPFTSTKCARIPLLNQPPFLPCQDRCSLVLEVVPRPPSCNSSPAMAPDCRRRSRNRGSNLAATASLSRCSSSSRAVSRRGRQGLAGRLARARADTAQGRRSSKARPAAAGHQACGPDRQVGPRARF